MTTAEDIVQMFLRSFFPADGCAKIMEVRGIVFRRRMDGKWVAEDGDLWQTAEKLVDELRPESLDAKSKQHAIQGVMWHIAQRSPSDGKDVLDGLIRRGFKIVSPSTGSWPIASA